MRKGSSARPSGSQPQATSVEREMDPRGADSAGKGGGPSRSALELFGRGVVFVVARTCGSLPSRPFW